MLLQEVLISMYDIHFTTISPISVAVELIESTPAAINKPLRTRVQLTPVLFFFFVNMGSLNPVNEKI